MGMITLLLLRGSCGDKKVECKGLQGMSSKIRKSLFIHHLLSIYLIRN